MQPWIQSIALSSLIVTGAQAGDIGRIKVSSGEAYISRGGEKIALEVGTMVQTSDTIVTGADGSVGITFVDNSMLSIGNHSSMNLAQFAFDNTTQAGKFDVALHKGSLMVVAGKLTQHNPDALKIKTPAAILAVRGTELAVYVEED